MSGTTRRSRQWLRGSSRRGVIDPLLLQLVTSMNLFRIVCSCNAVAPMMKQQRSLECIGPFSLATAQTSALVRARYSTSVIVMIIGAPTAPRGRIIRRRWIVSRGGRVVDVRVVIRVVVVGVCEHGTEGESSEPDPDGGTRADPTSTCICGPRHRRQPDSGNDRRGDGQRPTSLPKEPTNGRIPSLARRRRAGLVAVAKRRRRSDKAAHSAHRSSDGCANSGTVSTTSGRADGSAAACADEAATDSALDGIVGVGTGR